MHLFFRSSCPFIHNWISELKSHFFSLGLDPARPLVENKSPGSFRLTKNDADVVQIIQTNAGTLGQLSQSGTLNYCVNGGREQPYCKGHSIRKFKSTNYYFTIFISLVHPLCMRQFSLKRCGFNCEAAGQRKWDVDCFTCIIGFLCSLRSFAGKARCSHFLSVCYLANVVYHHKRVVGVPCPEGCLSLKKNRLPIYSRDIWAFPRYLRSMPFGNDAPEE